MYLTWSDVAIIMVSLLFAMLVSLLKINTLLIIVLVPLIIGTGLFLALLKPMGYHLFHYLSLVILYFSQPFRWVWRRGG